MLALLVILMAMGGGCKSKKKAAEAAAAAERARMEQEAAALKKQQEEEEARRRKEVEEEAARRAAEEARMKNPQAKLEQYFSSISNSSNEASANSSINEALTMFASADTPVLIVIHESGGQKDYDRPTTIKNYLNYLKDQKKQADKIGNLQFDNSGKITEVELVKQK
jgi:pyruvate/2-oxoglutarate dehydrogenase complex dihydrolipoamide acyltransferase (E2) component